MNQKLTNCLKHHKVNLQMRALPKITSHLKNVIVIKLKTVDWLSCLNTKQRCRLPANWFAKK